MRIALVGADFEENLGVGTVAAAAAQAGHTVSVTAFNEAVDAPRVVKAVMKTRPDVVGLSMQFQHRAFDFLKLCGLLRDAGFKGHITAGGRYPTAAWKEVLTSRCGLSSVVMYEGEVTLVELLAALSQRKPLHEVSGLALLSDDGVPYCTPHRRLPDELDPLPLPLRYRPHSKHLGIPFIPVMASRGCWGKCTYCSISSFYRDARHEGDSLLLRLRSPRHVAEEMAVLWHQAGTPCLFCFHDDNLLLPRPADTVARLTEIRRHLDDLGVGKIGIIGKARPDCITADLARQLADLGVIRLYVGVENASDEGAVNLGRGRQTSHVTDALKACRDAGIFVCYNLLVFEPSTALEDVRQNVDFMRQHPMHPVNFCRAEPYHGTLLHEQIKDASSVSGSYLGWNYRLENDRSELLFRICAAAFRERNFGALGVANRSMSLGYVVKVLEHFYADPEGLRTHFARRARELTSGITTETAAFLEEAIRLAEAADLKDVDRLERETLLLGLRVADADVKWLAGMDELETDMDAYARRVGLPKAPAARARQTVKRIAQQLALGATLTSWAAMQEGCSGCITVADPVPEDAGMVADPLPPDGGLDGSVTTRDGGRDSGMVADPLPVDAGRDAGMVADPLPQDAGLDAGQVADPLPPDAGLDAGMPVDPLPPDASVMLQTPAGGWRDSSPRSSVRSRDLPLFDPPMVALTATRGDRGIQVSLRSSTPSISTRWQAAGEVTGEGTAVTWQPRDESDRLRVAVRSAGGVAVLSVGRADIRA
jgi:radical SAM superfamily enzyme YgiQ (UPF0313 family)